MDKSMTEAHLYKNMPGKYKQNLIDDLQVWKFKASYRKSTR